MLTRVTVHDKHIHPVKVIEVACRECRQRRFARASLLGSKGDEYGVAHSVKFEGKK